MLVWQLVHQTNTDFTPSWKHLILKQRVYETTSSLRVVKWELVLVLDVMVPTLYSRLFGGLELFFLVIIIMLSIILKWWTGLCRYPWASAAIVHSHHNSSPTNGAEFESELIFRCRLLNTIIVSIHSPVAVLLSLFCSYFFKELICFSSSS